MSSDLTEADREILAQVLREIIAADLMTLTPCMAEAGETDPTKPSTAALI